MIMKSIKFVAFADIHGSAVFAEKLAAMAEEKAADAFLCAGDISNFGAMWRKPVEKLRIPVFFVRGNHEEEKTSREIMRKSRYFRDISYKTVKFKGVTLAGLPATYPFEDENPPQELSDPGVGVRALPARDKALDCFTPRIKGGAPLVLITHIPPMNTACDVERDGAHSGCPHVRAVILEIKPDAVVCGHYHYKTPVEDRIGKIKILNPGRYGQILTV